MTYQLMFYKSLGIVLMLMACICLYLSHSNQIFLKSSLTLIFRTLGWIGVIMAFVVLLYALPNLVAIFIGLAIAIAVWSFFPFIALLKRDKSNETI